MNINTVQGDSIEALLRQIGATQVTKVRGILYFIKFKLEDGIELSYTYNINAKNRYFLQRIKPYPIPQGVFTDELEIVSFIKQDLIKFSITQNSNQLKSFLDATSKINTIASKMENLFLNHTLDDEYFDKLQNELDDILDYMDK